MSEPFEGEAPGGDALPQLAGRARIVPARPTSDALSGPREMLPAVQAAAVAAGGFVAGAAFVGFVHHRRRRRAAPSRGRRARRDLSRGAARPALRAAELVQIVGSRSLLVDVHLLGSGDDR